MTKKGGIRFNEHEQVNIPIFGDQEIEIPEFLAEKTKKGYQLVPTLTKSGSITKRHKEPSIKLTPKNIEYFSIPKNGVERLQLADFVKKSKIELEKQYKVYSDFQNKLLEIELKNVLKIPEVKKTIAEAENKKEAIEEIKEVLAEEIFGDIPEPTVKKTTSKPKFKPPVGRKEFSEAKDLFGDITVKIRHNGDRTETLAKKILNDIMNKNKPIKKLLEDGVISQKEAKRLYNYVYDNMERYPNSLHDEIVKNKYNLVDQNEIDKYKELVKTGNDLSKKYEELRTKYNFKPTYEKDWWKGWR
jgi:hypothetical protein